jgi:hypothetical protein
LPWRRATRTKIWLGFVQLFFFFDCNTPSLDIIGRQIAQNKVPYITWDLAHEHIRARGQNISAMSS